jgi:hypothetical protein
VDEAYASYLYIKIKEKNMSQYPFKRLPEFVRKSVYDFVVSPYGTYMPYIATIKAGIEWSYFYPPKPKAQAFTIMCRLAEKTAIKSIGNVNGQFGEHSVDFDTTKAVLSKDMVIVKGYFEQARYSAGSTDMRNKIYDIEATFHQSQFPKVPQEIALSERERQILFCYGVLHDGPMRKEALCRLNVSKVELEDLKSKGLLKKIRNGFAMTLTGEVNRLPPTYDNKLIDIW